MGVVKKFVIYVKVVCFVKRLVCCCPYFVPWEHCVCCTIPVVLTGDSDVGCSAFEKDMIDGRSRRIFKVKKCYFVISEKEC